MGFPTARVGFKACFFVWCRVEALDFSSTLASGDTFPQTHVESHIVSFEADSSPKTRDLFFF